MSQLTSKNLGFGIGDIITAYTAGYHRVLEITPRYISQEMIDKYSIYKDAKPGDEFSPHIKYEVVFNSKFKKVAKSKQSGCDAAYCALVTPERVDEMIKPMEDLKQFVLQNRR